MDSILQEFSVTFRYPVHFTRGIFDPDNPVLGSVVGRGSKVAFVVDRGLLKERRNLPDQIRAMWPESKVLVIPGGERVKNHQVYLKKVLRTINQAGLCRHSFLVAVGGGAVLDVAGYAAATAHRGLRLARVPTTVLSQADSGVGVKNGVNAFGKKNYLGTFAPPYGVFNDFDFLRTLSARDWRAGIAEAVKVALIKDRPFFDWIEQRASALAERDQSAMEELIRRCAALHAAHIAGSGDPFELGGARPLDFGHWSAHKLEQITHYRLRHGEAVAIGIAIDSTYSYLSGRLAEGEWRRILSLFRTLRLPTGSPVDPEELLGGIVEFREHLGGELTIMLLDAIGHPFEAHEVDHSRMIRSMELARNAQKEDADALPVESGRIVG